MLQVQRVFSQALSQASSKTSKRQHQKGMTGNLRRFDPLLTQASMKTVSPGGGKQNARTIPTDQAPARASSKTVSI